MTTALSVASAPTDLFLDESKFNQAWRAAKLFSESQLVPQHLRGNPGDCMIALGLARELGDSPLHVMQAIYFVSGKAGFSASYMIARANQSGVFKGRISWRTRGQGDNLEVQAFAVLGDTGEEVTATTSMEMARAEGWTKNPKYRSMPEHMLRYRAATLLIRLYAPEVMHGYRTADELRDIGEPAPAPVVERGTVIPATYTPAPAPAAQPAPAPEPDTASIKAECAALEQQVGAANVELIRESCGPASGQDVTTWKGQAASATEYRDALQAFIASAGPADDGGLGF